MMMRYEEYASPLTLSRFIEAFWRFSLDAGDPAELVHTIVPDGAVSLAGSYWNGTLVGVEIVGPSEKAQQAQLMQGMTVVGARLCPGAASPLLGMAPAAIAGVMEPLQNDHWVAQALITGLDGLVSALIDRVASTPAPDPLVAAAAARMEAGEPVTHVADALGLSPRQLQRRFVAAVGLTPKTWQRVRRQRLAWINYIAGGSANLTDAAHSAGFSDSAHFSREARRMFQWSAGEVAAYLAKIDHVELQRPAGAARRMDPSD